MCLGSRVLYRPCLVERCGILGTWENPNSPIYAGLRLFYHAVFGFRWLFIVFMLVNGSRVLDWLDPQQGLLQWGCFLGILVSFLHVGLPPCLGMEARSTMNHQWETNSNQKPSIRIIRIFYSWTHPSKKWKHVWLICFDVCVFTPPLPWDGGTA